MITSSSDDRVDWKQPGGTCIGLVSIMVGRKMQGGRDQRKVMFVSAYKSCKQLDEGDSIATAHQKRQEGNAVYLGIDANSNIDKMELSKFVVEATQYDLMSAKHGKGAPDMHINGSRAVDYLFGSEDAVDSMEKTSTNTTFSEEIYIK
eukprot:1413118-Ditylum_brightwellii.AAC.1